MKIVILAGGFGSRLSEYTETIPKPMVNIGNKPILHHIMNLYSSYGFYDFTIALGYKSEIIKNYFINLNYHNSDIQINFKTKKNLSLNKKKQLNWKISLIDTGLNTMTGGRLKRLKKYIGNKTFMLTYGDGLCDIDIKNLLKFHKSHGKLVTVTAVHPTARFGELEISQNKVKSFKEKPQTKQGWINGGFFIMEPKFLDLIKDDKCVLENDPLEYAAKIGELMAYKHEGFWSCMDTKRDKDYLNDLWITNKKLWKKKLK
jgi:glucose-1-phosphate cytidylyltransferase